MNAEDTTTAAPAMSTAPVVASLEAAWQTLRERTPELPPAVFIVGAGSTGGGWLVRGSFAPERWIPSDRAHTDLDAPVVHEIMISGERLGDGPEGVISTLLHEAAHALARVRGIKETSRGGRYHNRRFAALAEELGLRCFKIDPIGFSGTELTPATRAELAELIEAVGSSFNGYRMSTAQVIDRIMATLPGRPAGDDDGDQAGDDGGDQAGDDGDARTRAGLPKPRRSRERYTCKCSTPRAFYMAPGVFAAGAVICDVCGEPFEVRP